jgi:GGDEF domain-containing protein
MIHLRRSVVFLILALTVFFNIEKVSQRVLRAAATTTTGVTAPNSTPISEGINIQTFVYILGTLAVVSVLTIPPLWRAGVGVSLTVWLMLYAIAKLVVNQLDWYDILGGNNAYLLFTEVGLLALLIWRARHVARLLHDFEEAVSNITFADVSRRVKKLDEAEEDIQLELIRSRRHHHPLTVMVVEPESDSIQVALNRTIQEVQRAMMSRYVITGLARVVSGQLRRTDLVIDQREKNRFIIISPDTSFANCQMLADRIQAAAAVQLGVIVSCGVASFPDEALTFDELVQQAKSKLSAPAAINSAAIPVYSKNDKASVE